MLFGASTFAPTGEGRGRGGGGAHDLSQATRGQWELRSDGVLQNPEEADEEQLQPVGQPARWASKPSPDACRPLQSVPARRGAVRGRDD